MIDAEKYGVSFSLKQCRNFGINPRYCLNWLITHGWRRFRLMSYWDEHEEVQGSYDFSDLDWQIAMIARKGGVISLCLGVKQPRWPEYHWPKWALALPKEAQTKALLAYLEAVANRYKDVTAITSYQLENEALLSNFGEHIDINRRRLRCEYELVRRLDPDTPIYMSTSNGWGVPVRRPKPAAVGFSVYTTMFQKGTYHTTIQRPWLHRLRHFIIHHILRRPVFIHELQCEPWGHTAIWKMTPAEQDRSMSPEHIERNIKWAHKIGVYPIDFWGAEWWYWRWQQGDRHITHTVERAIGVKPTNY